MALIKCTECGHMISDKAKKCPKCGNPVIAGIVQETVRKAIPTASNNQKDLTADVKRPNNTILYVIIGILAVALIVLGFFFLKSDNNDGKEHEKVEYQAEKVEGDKQSTSKKTFVYSIANDGFLNIRRSPSANSEIVGQLITGEDGAELLDNSGKWYKVKKDNVIGYVNSVFVSYQPPHE